MSEAGWAYFDVAADVGVEAWGPDVPACFRQCALGVFNLIVPVDAVRPDEEREVAARGDSPETLLVNWINECLYLHDIEGFVLRDLDLPVIREGRLDAMLRGEPVDRSRHPVGTLVKAATFHGLAIRETAGRVHLRLILDV